MIRSLTKQQQQQQQQNFKPRYIIVIFFISEVIYIRKMNENMLNFCSVQTALFKLQSPQWRIFVPSLNGKWRCSCLSRVTKCWKSRIEVTSPLQFTAHFETLIAFILMWSSFALTCSALVPLSTFSSETSPVLNRTVVLSLHRVKLILKIYFPVIQDKHLSSCLITWRPLPFKLFVFSGKQDKAK